jgi:hypothetical protein
VGLDTPRCARHSTNEALAPFSAVGNPVDVAGLSASTGTDTKGAARTSTEKPMADEQVPQLDEDLKNAAEPAGGLPDGIELDEPDASGPVP